MKPIKFLLILGVMYIATPANAQFLIGASAPLTGPFALLGHQISDGAKFAVETLNERGGVQGQKLELRLMDDGGNPEQATANTRELIDADKVAAIVGYPLSAEALAARNIASSRNILLVSLATAPELTQESRAPVLRTIGRADHLATMVADYIAANFQGKPLGALFALEQPAFNANLRRALDAKKLELKQSETSTIAALQKAPTWTHDVKVLILPPGTMPQIAGEISRENPALSLVAAEAVLLDEPSRTLEIARNTTIIANPWPELFSAARDTIARAKQRGLNTNGYFLYAYGAVQVVAAAITRANGQTSGSTLFETAQRSEGLDTVLGVLRFDTHGDIIGWRYAVLSASGGPDVCKTDQCKKYEVCPSDCPK